jgi:basic membrane protein A
VTRWLAVMLGAAALLAAAGCGGDDGGDGEAQGPGTTPTQTGEDDGRPQFRVGLVTDQGQLNDRGFNQLAFEGVKRAEAELGIGVRVIESASDADYVPNMTNLAEDGYDLVIGVGFAQGEAIDAVSVEFPETKFVIVDVDHADLPHTPPNVVGLLFQEEQVGYLAGYLAALVAAEDGGTPTISSVGGMKEPPVDRFIAGYRAGAEAAVPGIRLLNGYSQDWDDLAKCKEVALDQIERGSEVVFQVAGGCGLGALDAAKERGVWGIGVDADQSFLGPHVLTSAQKKVDEAVFRTIRSALDGTWEGGTNEVFGLEQDGVALGTVSERVSQEHLDALERVREQIASGEISDIPTTVG